MNRLSGAPRPLDHVAVAVHSIAESGPLFELLTGQAATSPEALDAHGVRVAFIGALELLEPLTPGTSVGRFLERNGPGLHHVAYRTPDIEADLARLEEAGVRLIDRTPRAGAHGHRVAFIHPSSAAGVLVELVERPS
jgi:methylmalonyl-CoA/ethylmalonyl-CoA epimerase